MKDKKAIALLISAIIIMVAFTAFVVTLFMKNVPLHKIEKTDAKVVETIGKKELYKGPTYRVVIEEAEGLHRVSKRSFKDLEAGDTIEGYKLGTYSFVTGRDLMRDLLWSLPYLIPVFVMMFSVFYALSFIIEPLNKMLRKTFPKRARPRKGLFLKGIGSILLLGLLIHSGQYIVNGVQKFISVNQTTTEAEIVDKYIEDKPRAALKQRHIFRLEFTDEDGILRTIDKTVAGTMYDRIRANNTLTISYVRSNPYQLYINDSKLIDLTVSAVYTDSLFHIAIIIGLLIAGVVLVRKAKHREKKETRK